MELVIDKELLRLIDLEKANLENVLSNLKYIYDVIDKHFKINQNLKKTANIQKIKLSHYQVA